MDGRGRSGTNNSSGVPASASVMSSYYGSNAPLGDSGNSYSSRDCFWTPGGSVGSNATDAWATNSYGQQLLPSHTQSPSYSPSHHNNSPPNNTGSYITSHSSYPLTTSRLPPPPINGNGMSINGTGNNGDLSPFSGPNSMQSIPYGAPPPSSPRNSRQYTPSTTPSPHVQQSPNINGLNGNSSSHSSHDSSPPNSGNSIISNHNNNNFDISYMNGNGGVDMNPSKHNGPSEQQQPGHPNDVPGYLSNSRHGLHNSRRYSDDQKASDGEIMQHQAYQSQLPYYHQNYTSQYGEQNVNSYYDSYNQNQRRPFDPYQPYPSANQTGYTETGYGSTEEYNSGLRTNANPDIAPNSVGDSGRRRDSISGLQELVENGTKIETSESLQQHVKTSPGGSSSTHEHGLATSFDEEPNFESVLHGQMNNYGEQTDHFRAMPNNEQENCSNSFQPPPPTTYSSNESQAQSIDSINSGSKLSPPKCDEIHNNGSSGNVNNHKPIITKKREKRKKNRSSTATTNNTSINNTSDCDDSKKKVSITKSKEKSFGNPQSPLNSNNSNSSHSSGSNHSRLQQSQLNNNIKIEGGESSSQPFSETGERSPNNNDTNNSNGSNNNNTTFDASNAKLNNTSSNSSESTTSTAKSIPSTTPKTTTKKKPWKKAKQVNSEQLLEERERNCAEYIEQSVCGKLKEKVETKPKVIRDEPPYIPLIPTSFYNSKREEKNITIDHQKEEKLNKQGSYEDKEGDNSNESSKQVDRKDVPLVECGCFPIDEVHPEPGPFYTHLGAAHTLPELRELLEMRTGFRGVQLRFEKVIYTGKEGKTSQGCPLAKWIIRRGSYEEQLLFLVKHRKGHKCATAWIVVCCVIWEAVPPHFADNLYDTVVYKLNRFGVPTTRRSDTNEQRSCACQGVDPDTCGAAYSFGCAWSMFFNGCKYARSRNVRKFRLTEEHEEGELEEKIQHLATHLAPLYERVASDSYRNQIEHENEGLECRLGYRPGRPFSGVTACLDYCSHAHKDAHNMINGCTVTVAFTRNRTLAKPDDEQFHVLPLYKLDETDEYGSKEGQKQKVKKGQLEILKKFQSKVRVRKVPLLPSRRRGKPKPPSSSSHSSHHHHPPPPKPTDLYSGDMSSLSMPPPIKREKMSIFDELNGPAGGSDLFDSRFPHGPTPPSHFSNLLLSKSHSKLGMGMGLSMSLEDHVQSCQISSTVLDSDGCPQTIWNSPYGQLPQSGHSHGQPGSSFRSYFDSPIAPTSQYPSKPASQYGHNLDFHLGSSPRGVGNSTMNNSGSNSNNIMTPNLNLNPNNVSNNVQNSSNSMTTPGYTSMSPSILPSFRHTFMTEAESLSMLSSMSSPSTGTGSPIADSTSSPRSAKPATGQQLNLGSSAITNNTTTPITPFSHHNDSFSLNSTSSYFNTPAPIVPPTPYSNSTNSNIYHPHPHHPTPSSCLSSAPNQVGVPFNSSTSYANSSSFVPPPPSMDTHHHSFGMGMNMNPLPSWNPNMSMNPPSYSHHGYGSIPPPAPTSYHHAHNQMSSLGVNSMTPSAFPHMNQYNPYGNQSNFISPHTASAIHSHHHPTNPWVSPLPSFMSGPHAHPPPPAPSCFVAPPKPKVIPEVNETLSDNEDAFKDSHLGGVGIALTHGAVILQCAKHEMHATTSLKSPNRMYPSRICLVFYQHKSMNNRFHGWSEWEKKIENKKLQEVKLINQGKLEASPRKMKQLIKEGYLADNP